MSKLETHSKAKHAALSALILVTVFIPVGAARANIILGEHLGIFSGNDREAVLLNYLDLQVTQLAKAATT